MAYISRFKKRNSDRSGFKENEIELIRDKGFLVSGNEFDTPPPSDIPLGGEGDLSGDPRSSSSFEIGNINTAVNDQPTYYITAGGGIPLDLSRPVMKVTGSNSAVDITANPQIVRGKEGDILTLLCVDSRITLDHGSGLNMMGSSMYALDSGDSITFYYSSGGTIWNETSRFKR